MKNSILGFHILLALLIPYSLCAKDNENVNVSKLIKKMKKAKGWKKVEIIKKLSKFKSKANPAIPYLISLLKNSYYAEYAAEALGKISSKSINSYLQRLSKDKDLQNTRLSRLHLEIIFSQINSEKIPILVKALDNKNISVKKAAVVRLGKLGSKGKVAFSKLVFLLKNSKDWKLQGEIGIALAKIDPKRASQVLGHILETVDNNQVESAVLNGLYHTGKEGHRAIPSILKKIKDSDHRRVKFLILKKIGTKAVPTLIQLLKSKDSEVRRWAAITLGKMKSQPKLIENALVKSLKDSNANVRNAVNEAIIKIRLRETKNKNSEKKSKEK